MANDPEVRDERPDSELVALAKAGDEPAFEALVKRYQRRAYQLAIGMVKDGDLAMDVVQEAFVKVYKYLPDFKGDASFYTWLYRITANLSIDARRREQARGGEKVELTDRLGEDEVVEELLTTQAEANPAQRALDGELSDELEAALRRLPEKHREILVLREVEGLSYEELAATLGIKKGTVMSRLFHARAKMQKLLAGYLGRKAVSS